MADEMLHQVAFHKGLNSLLRKKRYSKKETQYSLEIITCNPLIYTVDHSELTVSKFMEISIDLIGFKRFARE